jgi:hypothetical protein
MLVSNAAEEYGETERERSVRRKNGKGKRG